MDFKRAGKTKLIPQPYLNIKGKSKTSKVERKP